jgi:hypothetical protein
LENVRFGLGDTGHSSGMAHHEKVPETRDDAAIKPTREQRRHPEKFERPENDPLSRSTETQPEILEQGSQDVQSVRAKNSGHGKKTADKWNQ